MNPRPILLVGYSLAWQAVMANEDATDPVVFVEEPDVARKRNVDEHLAGSPAELIRWEYQLPGAADRFYLAHRDLDPIAILPGVEYAVPFAARLAERYGVAGAGLGAATLLSDKALLRTVTREAGIANPRSERVHGPGEVRAFMRDVGGPIVLKPANRQASVGTQILRDPGAIDAAWDECTRQDEGVYAPDRDKPLDHARRAVRLRRRAQRRAARARRQAAVRQRHREAPLRRPAPDRARPRGARADRARPHQAARAPDAARPGCGRLRERLRALRMDRHGRRAVPRRVRRPHAGRPHRPDDRPGVGHRHRRGLRDGHARRDARAAADDRGPRRRGVLRARRARRGRQRQRRRGGARAGWRAVRGRPRRARRSRQRAAQLVGSRRLGQRRRRHPRRGARARQARRRAHHRRRPGRRPCPSPLETAR